MLKYANRRASNVFQVRSTFCFRFMDSAIQLGELIDVLKSRQERLTKNSSSKDGGLDYDLNWWVSLPITGTLYFERRT